MQNIYKIYAKNMQNICKKTCKKQQKAKKTKNMKKTFTKSK